MSQEIIVAQRRLGKVDVVVVDPFEQPSGIVPVLPTVAEVECKHDIVARHLAAIADERNESPIR